MDIYSTALYRRKEKSFGQVVASVIGGFISDAVRVLIVMLILGWIHSFEPRVPAYGYWEVLAFLMVIGAVLVPIVKSGVRQALKEASE